MSQQQYPQSHTASNQYASFGYTVAQAPADERVSFIRKTYMHVAAAVYLFVFIEFVLFKTLPLDKWFGGGVNMQMPMLVMFGGFIFVSWLANKWAHSETSVGKQYAGLVMYVLAECAIFVPLLYFAKNMTLNLKGMEGINVLPAAAVITLLLFSLLTAIVFFTKKDFSFMRSILTFGSIAAFVVMLAGIFLGFHLGLFFSGAMITLACGYILYDTSNVLHHYRPGQHVAASLALFSSLALLFWYVIRLLMAFASDD